MMLYANGKKYCDVISEVSWITSVLSKHGAICTETIVYDVLCYLFYIILSYFNQKKL